jgi:fructose-1-phosphate kinase PfkB-like protein
MKVSHFTTPMDLTNDDWEDAFCAGILYGIANKKPIETVVKFACSLASEQVQLRAYEIKTAQKEI